MKLSKLQKLIQNFVQNGIPVINHRRPAAVSSMQGSVTSASYITMPTQPLSRMSEDADQQHRQTGAEEQ